MNVFLAGRGRNRPAAAGPFESYVLPHHKKDQFVKNWSFLWWGRTDSNHRSETQQIYSLSPLATRELPRMFSCCLLKQNGIIITRNSEMSRGIS